MDDVRKKFKKFNDNRNKIFTIVAMLSQAAFGVHIYIDPACGFSEGEPSPGTILIIRMLALIVILLWLYQTVKAYRMPPSFFNSKRSVIWMRFLLFALFIQILTHFI